MRTQQVIEWADALVAAWSLGPTTQVLIPEDRILIPVLKKAVERGAFKGVEPELTFAPGPFGTMCLELPEITSHAIYAGLIAPADIGALQMQVIVGSRWLEAVFRFLKHEKETVAGWGLLLKQELEKCTD